MGNIPRGNWTVAGGNWTVAGGNWTVALGTGHKRKDFGAPRNYFVNRCFRGQDSLGRAKKVKSKQFGIV